MGYRSLQITLEIETDPDPGAMAARTREIERRARAALSGLEGIEVEDMAVQTPASLDPAQLTELATLVRLYGELALAGAGAVGAAALLLGRLRQLVAATGALVRTIKLEIDGTPTPLEQVTEEQVAAELRRPARAGAGGVP